MSLAVYDLRSDRQHGSLEARNPYQVEVNIFNAKSCGGNQVATRNHDERSCNAGTTADGYSMNSARVKGDGTAKGSGCMTVFQSTDCKQTDSESAQVFVLQADDCIDFAWSAECVVVSSLEDGGTCTLRGVSC